MFLQNNSSPPELEDLGRRIRGRRLEIRLSQETGAEKAGISPNTVSRIERGQVSMSIEIFCRLLYILDTDACRLIGTKENVMEENVMEENCRCLNMLREIRCLGKKDREIVMQTAEKMLDMLFAQAHVDI